MTLVRSWFVGGLAVAHLLGCASAPPNPRTVLAGNAAETVVVLPLNVSVAMPQELDALSPYVWKELIAYLTRHGKTLKTVSFSSARYLWLNSVKRAHAGGQGSRAGYDDAVRLLVHELAKHAEFDAVIAPSLYLRKANINGMSASWDGVERDLEIEENGRKTSSIPATAVLVGVAPAASLHVVVLNSDGDKVHEAQGGLELLVSVRVMRKNGFPNVEWTLDYATRSGLFENREHIHEGIGIALAPFLPRLRLPAQ